MKTITCNGATLKESIQNLFEEIKNIQVICVGVYSSEGENRFYSHLFYIEQKPKNEIKTFNDFCSQIKRMKGFSFSGNKITKGGV
jgi:hypothetical protein